MLHDNTVTESLLVQVNATQTYHNTLPHFFYKESLAKGCKELKFHFSSYTLHQKYYNTSLSLLSGVRVYIYCMLIHYGQALQATTVASVWEILAVMILVK